MKKAIVLVGLVMLVALSLNMVNAKTLVAGKVYDMTQETVGTVDGAEVNVSCNGLFNQTMTNSDGSYSVSFDDALCNESHVVDISAQKGGLYGESPGNAVHDLSGICDGCNVYMSVGNVFMIPEFGFFVGLVTILGAVGVFFFVRR
jgi:hypothetical protein